jgi:DNA-binding MarR family transcriptional regulator
MPAMPAMPAVAPAPVPPYLEPEPRAEQLRREAHLDVLLLANRNLEAVEAICQDHGITHAQLVALWTLCLAPDADEGIPIGAVVDGLLTRAADTTRLVDRLERAGLAERLPNPADRRSVLVRTTTNGRQVAAGVTPALQAFHRQQWSALTDDEVETLHHLLAKALWGDS